MRCAAVVLLAAACSSSHDTTSPPTLTTSPCSITGTLQLSTGQGARVDCSNGGTAVTLGGSGASYLVVPQFAASLVPNVAVSYRLTSGTGVAASVARSSNVLPAAGGRPNLLQMKFDGMLRARARVNVKAGVWRAAKVPGIAPSRTIVANLAPPSIGSLRSFRVIADSTGSTFKSVGAQLAFAGNSVLIYVDTLAPANGFSASQLPAFGTLFDQTLYPIETAAFGPPSDVDQNGSVIMLMSPLVNALSPASKCATQGFVAGFFDEEDLGGNAGDQNSNHGEMFYSIVPDPNGASSCVHTVADVGFFVPDTFMHELQHLISFSQHFVIHNGQPEFGWLDEGMSIVAEELGSLYYEQKCPGTACRTDPQQIFPDSSQEFVSNFLFDSYAYALRPDTASMTLHGDSDGGFAWRGGDWLLARWLADHFGSSVLKRLEQSAFTGVANIEAATSQSFPSLFASLGLAIYADSLPTLPRTTAPLENRFVTRNLRQLWARLFVTSNGDPSFPLAFPIRVVSITSDSTAHSIVPGTSSYYRLDTPAGASTVTIQFASPTGSALSAGLRPQLAIFRLPAGQ
jgi:hypothetical protein